MGQLKAYSAGHSASIATKHGVKTIKLSSSTKLVAADKLAGSAPKAGDDVAAWLHGRSVRKFEFGLSPFAISSRTFRGKFHSYASHDLSVATSSSGIRSFQTTWQTKYTLRGRQLAKPHFVSKEPLLVTQNSMSDGSTVAGDVSLDDTGKLPNANDGQWVVGTIKDYTAGTSVTITTASGDVVVPLDSGTQLVDASGGSNAPATSDQAAALLSSQDGPGDGNGNGGGDHARRSDGSGTQVADLLEFDTVVFPYASEDIQGQIQTVGTNSLTIADTCSTTGGGTARRADSCGGDSARHADGCSGDATRHADSSCSTGPWTVGLDSNTQYFQDDQPLTTPPTFATNEAVEVSANIATDGTLTATVVNLPESDSSTGGDS